MMRPGEVRRGVISRNALFGFLIRGDADPPNYVPWCIHARYAHGFVTPVHRHT